MKICDGYSNGQVARELMSYNHKKKSEKQAAGASPNAGLSLGDHTNQEAHDAPWFGARGSNTGPKLATPGGAPLRQCCCGTRDFVSILANARFSDQDRPIYGPVAGYLLTCPISTCSWTKLPHLKNCERSEREIPKYHS